MSTGMDEETDDSATERSQDDPEIPERSKELLEAFIESKRPAGTDSDQPGKYASNLRSTCGKFLEWAATTTGESADPEDWDDVVFRRYARYLKTRDISPSSVNAYYKQVSSWIGWLVREGVLPEHYARRTRAMEPLPDEDSSKQSVRDQQSWSPEQRTQLLRYVDEAADEALDEATGAAYKPFRDRAIAYLLAYTGIRASELFHSQKDARRDGITWDDLDLSGDTGGVVRVVPKKGSATRDSRAIPPQAIPALEQWRELLDPKPDWPVFPTVHRATIYSRLRETMSENDVDDDAIEERINNLYTIPDMFDALEEYDVAPKAIDTNAARNIMKRLTEDAGIELDDKHGYLSPHGARRGVGEVLVRERSVTEAAQQLDNSEEVVRKHYSHITAEERSQDVGRAFEDHDEKGR